MSWASKINSIMENEDVDIPTIEQGTTNDNQTPTFQDTLNNYEQLLINREGSLKPDRYSLIDEIKEGNIGGALNQSIDQFFQNKWEGLGPENQDLILQGIDTIQKGKELTKSNWKKYPVESSLWHAIDFIGAVAGPIYQAGTTVTANVGERGFGINRELIEKANTINQIRTGKVFPFLPNRIPGVNLRPKDIGISSKIEKITPLPPKNTKRMFNITKDITEITSAPSSYLRKVSAIYKHHEGGITWKQAMMMAKLPKSTSSIHLYKDSEVSIKKGGLLDPDRQEPTEMYSTGVEPEINWNKYGYTPGTEPTQVRNVTIPELKTQVANSLDAFYQKTQEVVQSRLGSKATSKQIREVLKTQPQYWTNPVTQKLYRVAWKGGLSKRYTLKPINRQYLEKQQSTGVQKQIASQYQKGLQKKNVDLKQAHDDKYNLLEKELSSVQATIADYRKRGITGPDYDTAIAKQNDLNTQINNLEEGRWYTEHNIYLQSEKARNYILDNSGTIINDSSEFQLGNIANQTPRLENLKNPDTLVFKQLKDKLEKVLDEAPDEYFSYPNYIVNSNPRLSGGREGIIRIEYSPVKWQQVPGSDPPIMRPVLTDFKVKGGILSGKSVIEIDTKDLDFIRNNLSTTEDIKNWLSSEHGINPVAQGDSFPRQGFQIRLSKSPVKSTQVQIKEFKKLIEDVQAGRKTWADVFAEEGIEIVPQTGAAKVKGKGGRPKGSPNKVKGEKGGNLLDILFPDRNL